MEKTFKVHVMQKRDNVRIYYVSAAGFEHALDRVISETSTDEREVRQIELADGQILDRGE